MEYAESAEREIGAGRETSSPDESVGSLGDERPEGKSGEGWKKSGEGGGKPGEGRGPEATKPGRSPGRGRSRIGEGAHSVAKVASVVFFMQFVVFVGLLGGFELVTQRCVCISIATSVPLFLLSVAARLAAGEARIVSRAVR